MARTFERARIMGEAASFDWCGRGARSSCFFSVSGILELWREVASEIGPCTHMLFTDRKVRIEENSARGLDLTGPYDQDNQTILAK